jgi:hypothetical protein
MSASGPNSEFGASNREYRFALNNGRPRDARVVQGEVLARPTAGNGPNELPFIVREVEQLIGVPPSHFQQTSTHCFRSLGSYLA